MLKRLRDWIRERPKTLRFCLTVVLFVLVLGTLLAIAVRTADFVENLALNMVSEIAGAFVVIYLLEGYMRRAREEMEKELESHVRRAREGIEKELEVLRRTLDDALVALDRGEIERNEVEAFQQLHSLNKWLRGDDVGWYELQEMVEFAGGLSPAAHRAVKMELRRIQQETRETGGQTKEQREREQRLRSLLVWPPGKQR
jgi:Predicted ABC-type exoprotein transport system, permease component